MEVDTIVLMDHTTPTNEYHDNYANNNNYLNRGSVVHLSQRVTADLTFSIILKSTFII